MRVYVIAFSVNFVTAPPAAEASAFREVLANLGKGPIDHFMDKKSGGFIFQKPETKRAA